MTAKRAYTDRARPAIARLEQPGLVTVGCDADLNRITVTAVPSGTGWGPAALSPGDRDGVLVRPGARRRRG